MESHTLTAAELPSVSCTYPQEYNRRALLDVEHPVMLFISMSGIRWGGNGKDIILDESFDRMATLDAVYFC